MKKLVLVFAFIIASLSVFAQDATFTLRLKGDNGIYSTVTIEDYGSRSYLTVDGVGDPTTIEISSWREIPNGISYTCVADDGVIRFDFDFANSRFKLYLNGSLVLRGDILSAG